MSVSDTFNRADGGLGANWTSQVQVPAIASNVAYGDAAGGYTTAFYSALSFSNDQTAQVLINNSVNYCAPGCRMSALGGSANWYAHFSHAQLQKSVSGSVSTIASGWPISVGDTLKVGAVGTTITAYVNGASVGSITDSALASGAAGIGFYNSTAGADDWLATGEIVSVVVKPMAALGVG